MADAQHLALGEGGQVARIVGEGTHVSGNRRNGRLVGKVVVIAAEQSRLVGEVVVIATKASGQFHKSAVGQEERVVADAQHLALGEGGQVARVVGESTHVGGNRWDGRLVGKVVIVTARGDGREIGFPVKVAVVAAGGDGREVRLVD